VVYADAQTAKVTILFMEAPGIQYQPSKAPAAAQLPSYTALSVPGPNSSAVVASAENVVALEESRKIPHAISDQSSCEVLKMEIRNAYAWLFAPSPETMICPVVGKADAMTGRLKMPFAAL